MVSPAWKSWFSPKQIAVILLLLLGLAWLLSYRISEFKGDGTISDAGLGSNPRYVVKFDQIPLHQASTHQFHLQGLPFSEMSFRMNILGKSDQDWKALTKLKTKIAVSLDDNRGHVLCSCVGVPTNSELDRNNWILTINDHQASYYHFSCLGIQLSRFKTYTLKISLTDVDPNSPEAYLVPELLDGGDEWL